MTGMLKEQTKRKKNYILIQDFSRNLEPQERSFGERTIGHILKLRKKTIAVMP